jgi:hypothetical protein
LGWVLREDKRQKAEVKRDEETEMGRGGEFRLKAEG